MQLGGDDEGVYPHLPVTFWMTFQDCYSLRFLYFPATHIFLVYTNIDRIVLVLHP